MRPETIHIRPQPEWYMQRYLTWLRSIHRDVLHLENFPCMSKTPNRILPTLLTVAIALVWLINGLVCKVLNYVPRHRMIVVSILGETHAAILTTVIGLSEILIALWIMSGIKSRWCTLFQIAVVVVMNILEFILVPHLLLFGRLNAVFATVFLLVVYTNEFVLQNRHGLRYLFIENRKYY
jgi:hypothetical protein